MHVPLEAATPVRTAGKWRQRASTKLRWAAMAGTPLALVISILAFWDTEPAAEAAAPRPSVTVAHPLQRNVIQWDDYVGRFEASRTVEVRPRVSGQIVAVHFADGAIVTRGQLLFTLDQRPFAAALEEARAGVATARSELALAITNLDRARRLLAEEAVSQSSVDQLTAMAQTAQAGLSAAEARVRARALDVEFTQIRAPISGRISDAQVDPGNLVSGGDSAGTMLTSINALDPIHFTFDVPESLLLKSARARRTGAGGQVGEIRLQDEPAYSWQGRLDFVDNSLNRTSGTIRARTVVRNPDYFLTPGMFGNMRLGDGRPAPALLVPDAAIRTDQARKIVLVVDADGLVSARPVETGPLIGGLRVIRSGIRGTDRVILQGLLLAIPGRHVSPRLTRIRPSDASTSEIRPYSTPSASQATLASD